MIFKKIIATLLLASQFAWAGLPPTTLQGQNDAGPTTTFSFQVPNSQATRLGGPKALIETGNLNQLPNPGFNGIFTAGAPANWTTTSGTPSQDTTNYLDGKTSVLVTASAQQSLIAQDFTPTVQWGSVNLEYSCWVKTSMTTAQVCARQGAATVGACASVPGTGKWQYVAVNYPGPSSGSVGVSVGLSASGTGTYNVDTCYVGPVRNLSQVSQAQDLGSLTFPSNASCVWTITQTTFASDFPAVAACGTPTISSGSSLTSPSKTPQTQLANAQPGSYQVTWTSVVGTGASVGGSCQIIDDLGNVLNQQAFGTLSSATPSYTLTGTWPYSTAGNRTWKVQCASASGLVNIYTNVSTPGTAGFQVKYFPNQSQTAVNANTFGSSNVTVTTGNGYGSTNTGVRRFSTIQRQSGIDITYTDSATLGGSFTINTPGVYSMNLCDFANTSTVEPYISYNASTFTVGLNSPLGGMAEQASSSATNSCIGISYYLNQNDIIRAQEAFGATASNLDSRTSFSITKVMPSQPAPVLVGSVTSQSAGALHIESAAMSAVCSVGACALSSSTPGISSITFSSTGVYNVVFATGAFSAAPTCTCNDTNTTARTCSPQPSSNIAAQLGSMTAASATLANGQLSVICMGPR